MVMILGQKYFLARSPVDELKNNISQIPTITSISNDNINDNINKITPHLVIICRMVIILVRSFYLKNSNIF